MGTVTIGQAIGIALDHQRHGRLAEAIAVYQEILKVDAGQTEALARLGEIFLVIERYGPAAELLGQAAGRVPDALALHILLGDALEGLGRAAAAAARYRLALALDPGRSDTYGRLGGILKSDGRTGTAAVAYRRAAAVDPQDGFARDNALLCRYLAEGRPPDGLSWSTGSPPPVTVVIPCYNYGRYVVEAVDSVLAQTYGPLDVIVVDGGSGPETLSVLEGLRRPRTRILLREGRHLVGDNRNTGIAMAQSPYVCCLDADDRLDPTYIGKAVFLLDVLGYDVAGSQMVMFGASDRRPRWPVERLPKVDGLVQVNNVGTAAVFRRSLWERAGGYRDFGLGADYVYEDWNMWVRLAALGARIINMDERLFHYRVHDQPRITTQAGLKPPQDHSPVIRESNRDVLPPHLW